MKTYTRYFMLSVLCFVCLCRAYSQPPSKFYTAFGGSGYDYGYDVKQTLDKGYIITGSTSSFGQGNTDLYLVKLDSMGTRLWEKAYGNYNNEVGKSVVQLADSGYVMAGYTNSTGFGGYDFYMVRVDKQGTLLWEKTFGGADWDFAYSLKQTSDGGFIMCGTTYSYGRGQADGYIVRTNSSGALLWNKTYGGASDDEFKSVIQTSDGGFALAGYTKSYADANGDAWIFKLNAVGDSLYSDSRGGSYSDFFNAVIELQNNALYFSGGNRSLNNNTNSRTWNYCINTAYSQLWDYVDAGTNDEYYFGAAQGLNGVIASCGTTNNPVTKLDGLIDMVKSNFSYLNFAARGSIDNDDEFYGMDKTRDKGFVMVGMTKGFNASLVDVFLFKTDSVGNFSGNITGIQAENAAPPRISMYPNPSAGSFNVQNGSSQAKALQVLDLSGRVLYACPLGKGLTNIDLSASGYSGLYIVQALDQQNRVLSTEKIVFLKP